MQDQEETTLILGDPQRPIAIVPKEQAKELVDLQVLRRLGVRVTETTGKGEEAEQGR